MTADQEKLAAWVDRISNKEMPVFGSTAQEIAKISSSESAPTNALVSAILQDSAMTARVLRLANSVYFGLNQRLSTISRAIVVLGFDAIRSICLTVSVIGSLLKGAQRSQLQREMARSFYAATLARTLAEKRGDGSPEEVFIAALLYRIGEMAFWCFADDIAAELEKSANASPAERAKAEKDTLGFTLNELTGALAREWNLSDLLCATLSEHASPNPRTKGIVLGHQFAEAVEHGLNAAETQRLAKTMADYLGSTPESVYRLILENSKKAAQVARHFGANVAAKQIPGLAEAKTMVPPDTLKESEEFVRELMEADEDRSAPEFFEPNPTLQLKVLREIVLLVKTHPDVNSVLQLVLEGMYRGIGMDRAAFLFLAPDRRHFYCKFALGSGSAQMMSLLSVESGGGRRNVFAQLTERKQSQWVPKVSKLDAAEISPELMRFLGEHEFFIAPILIEGRVIGMFYVDRALSGRALDQESFESFDHFVQQSSLSLESLKSRTA